MHVPDVFNNALDIRLTNVVEEPLPVWTQGGNFAFSTGDVLYDTPLAYGEWEEALRHVRVWFSVSHATAVSPPSGGAARRPGSVTFSIMALNETRTALTLVRKCVVTQDEFVLRLIAGIPDDESVLR